MDSADASVSGVVTALVKWFDVSEDIARTLIQDYAEEVQKGIAFRSHNSYVAFKIGELAELTEREGVEEDEPEDDDDEF